MIDPKATLVRLPGIILSFVLALLGVGIFQYFDFPLPWLLGAIFPLIIASKGTALPIVAPTKLVHPSRGMLGVAIGASFTPALLQEIDVYLLSLVFMLPFLVVVILMGRFYYNKVIGLDRESAVFCAFPGGLLEMTILSESAGANVKSVVLAHTTRVLLIIYTIPFLIQYFTTYDLSGNFVNPGGESAFDPLQASIIVGSAVFGWYLVKTIGWSGASIVGPMTACAVIYLMGWVDYKLPGWLLNAAQMVLGMRVGLSLKDITFGDIWRNVIYAIGFFILLMAASLLTAYVVYLVTELPLIAVFLAYVPGGQAEMNVIAIVVGLHVPYIALHHVTRMFLVIAFAPNIQRWLN